MMSCCPVINCNSKTKNNREVFYFQLTKNTSVHKGLIHATGAQLKLCSQKQETFNENFLTAIPRNKRNMFIAILLSFFITYFANFIHKELSSSIKAETYSEPYKEFKMQFLAKMFNSSRGAFRTESRI